MRFEPFRCIKDTSSGGGWPPALDCSVQAAQADVARIFETEVDPRSLLEEEHVEWVLVDEERGVPAWAASVKPAVRFDRTVVLRADQLLDHLRKEDRVR